MKKLFVVLSILLPITAICQDEKTFQKTKYHGRFNAKQNGLRTDGSDQTSVLNSLALNPSVNEILLDDGNVTVSGTVNFQNRKVVFQNNSQIVGSGRIQNLWVEADPYKQIFGSGLNTTSSLLNTTIYPKWWGFISDGSTDCKPALKNAINASVNYAKIIIAANLPNDDAHSGPYYYFSDSVGIYRKIELAGEGQDKTVFSFPGTAGLYFDYTSTGSYIHDFKVIGRNSGYAASGYNSNTKHGIWNAGINIFERVTVSSFDGDGFHVFGDVNAKPYSNASLSRFISCFAFWNGRNGWNFRGGDANACVIENCNAQLNKRWGFMDSSFLGNTFTSNHAASNGTPESGGRSLYVIRRGHLYHCITDNINKEPGVAADWKNYWQEGGKTTAADSWDNRKHYYTGSGYAGININQQGVFISNYSEGDQPVFLNSGNIVLGGFLSQYGRAHASIGTRQGLLSTKAIQAFEESVGVGVMLKSKGDNYSDGFSGFHDEVNNLYAGFDYSQKDKAMRLSAGNPTYTTGYLFTPASPANYIGRNIMPSNGALALNSLWLLKPSNGTYRMFGFRDSATAPSGFSTQYAAGDFLLYTGSEKGSTIVGFRCIESGTPGKWLVITTNTSEKSNSPNIETIKRITSASYTLLLTDKNIVNDYSGGSLSLTLPPSPGDGQTYYISNQTANTISFSSNIFESSSKSFKTISKGTGVKIIYSATDSKWYRISFN